MSTLHATLATTIVLYLALVGLWGLWLGVRAQGPSSSFRGALVIAEGAAIAQGLVGLLLALQRPLNGIHALYGVALVLALPLAATLVRGRAPRGQSVALGIAALFTAGLAIRGITTGGGMTCAAGIVTRMWTDERIVVKHLAEPDQRGGIRIPFWALHQATDLQRLAGAFARQCAVPA